MAPGVLFEGSDSSNPPGATGGDVPQPPPLPSAANSLPSWKERQQFIREECPPTPDGYCDQFTNLPDALINSLKREKKPFTYTPGGIDLSEIKSPRIQKRLQANKRLQGISPLAKTPESTENDKKELLVMPVYNSPLNLYSTQNAKEEFQKQANLLTQELESMKISSNGEIIRSQSFGHEGFPKYSQSKSFRLLQLMTDTTETNDKVDYESPRRKCEEDEMTFSGITRNPVPSKFFQTLQRITGTDGNSPETPPVIEHYDVPCTLQTATFGKDFVPAPKPYKPFEKRDFNEKPVETPRKKSQINIQVGGHYTEPTYQKQEFQQQNQSLYQQNEQHSQNKTISGHQRSSNIYEQKNPQPYIRPRFQAKEVATSNSWQPFSHPYNYCTLPRSYRGIPGLEGTDL